MDECLGAFIAKCESVTGYMEGAAERVTALAPLMQNLVARADNFLFAENIRSEPEYYSRNAVHIASSGNLSLFALVWLPG